MYCIIVVLYNYYCRHCIFLFVTLFESLYCISCGSKVIHEIIARKRDRDLLDPGGAWERVTRVVATGLRVSGGARNLNPKCGNLRC